MEEKKTEIKIEHNNEKVKIEDDKKGMTIAFKTHLTPNGFKGREISRNRIRFSRPDPETGKAKYFYFDLSIQSLNDILNKADEIILDAKKQIELKKKTNNDIKPVIPKERQMLLPSLKDIKLNTILNDSVLPDAKKNSGSTFLFLASSKAGKSTLMAQLIKRLNNKLKTLDDEAKKPINIVMSNTLSLDKSVFKTLSNETLFSEYNDEMIENVADIQKKTSKKFPFIISCDDIIDQKNNMALKKLYTTYRNLNIYSLIALQSANLFNKSNRGQVNHIFIGRQNNGEISRDVIEKFILGCYNPKDDKYIKNDINDLIEWVNKETNDHNFIYINMLNNNIYKLKKES